MANPEWIRLRGVVHFACTVRTSTHFLQGTSIIRNFMLMLFLHTHLIKAEVYEALSEMNGHKVIL